MTVRVALVAVAVLALLAPASASAATCSDHSTQAAALRAADTRDADLAARRALSRAASSPADVDSHGTRPVRTTEGGPA